MSSVLIFLFKLPPAVTCPLYVCHEIHSPRISCRILLRQLLRKICNFLVVVFVVPHVSAPYSSTDFILELNRRVFVCNDNTLELRMFLSWINPPLAWPILALTSKSIPPCSIILPRYVKVSTSSI